jgi:hypothetical protein
MSSTLFNFGNSRGDTKSGLSLLETLLATKTNAQRQVVSELRRNLPGLPVLDAALNLLESVSNRRADFERSLLGQLERAKVQQRTPVDAQYEGGHTPEQASREAPVPVIQNAHFRTEAEQRHVALRVTIPQGLRGVVVPLQLRNHREAADLVAFSATAPSLRGVTPLPIELIRFDPEMLSIPPGAQSVAQLLLQLNFELEPSKEYWAEIVIAGKETKRIPLILQARELRAEGT